MSESGSFNGKTHILPIRIYYEDTDVSGVVYHANYLRYMERARSEFFRKLGITKLAQLEQPDPSAWTLTKIDLEYRRPARLDDLITVRTRCIALSGARLTVEQNTYKSEMLLVTGRVEACIMALTGRPRRIPEDIYQRLAPYLQETTV
ncbi:MAG TPA: YbgC/FadM family acyl-CoA thioesterase [Rhizomicrobium sp.]